MPIIRIENPDDPRLAPYRNVPDPELAVRAGLFVAEGRQVVRRLVKATRLTTRSTMVTEAALRSLADLPVTHPELAVYVVPQGVMNALTGFNIHRGCLALGERPAPGDWRELLLGSGLGAPGSGPGDQGSGLRDQGSRKHAGDGSSGALSHEPKASSHPPRRLVVLERVGDADNVGSVFRSAAALGAEAVLLGPGCADPLYRKAIRTSMGAALTMPFSVATPWPGALQEIRAAGMALVALTPSPQAPRLREVVSAIGTRSVAILVGHEGEGLTGDTLELCDFRARIPIAPELDSLNVATAAAIALYELAEYGHVDTTRDPRPRRDLRG
jgi:tRNA G18 (ribose-2'-O)-methylase SpoU